MKNAPALGVDLSRNQQRNASIRAEYQKLFGEGFRSDVILKRLADRFYLQEDTIERIVFQRGHYRPTAASASGATAA